MRTISFKSLNVEGDHVVLSDERAALYPADAVTTWEFSVDTLTNAILIDCGNLTGMQPLMLAPNGVPHSMDSYIRERHAQMVNKVVKSWSKSPGDPLPPITIENARALPPSVLTELGLKIEYRTIPTPEEMAARQARLDEAKND